MSTTRGWRPERAAARAVAAATTAWPAPRFPATMTSRDAAKNGAVSTEMTFLSGRRALRRLAMALVVLGTLVLLAGGSNPAVAQTSDDPSVPPAQTVTIVKVSGRI